MGILSELGGLDEGDAVVRFSHVRALTAAGRVQEADAARDAAGERLRAAADRIADPAWRRSFLERVAENRALP
jgi:eukaryotic-like serine/threonine-protein kinase